MIAPMAAGPDLLPRRPGLRHVDARARPARGARHASSRRWSTSSSGMVKIGDPADPSTFLGPVIRDERRTEDRGVHRVRQARGRGARAPAAAARRTCRAATSSSRRSSATCRNDIRIAQEEIFGPVVSVIPFKDDDEAIAHRQRLDLRARRRHQLPRHREGARARQAHPHRRGVDQQRPQHPRRARSAASRRAASAARAAAAGWRSTPRCSRSPGRPERGSALSRARGR